MACTDTPICTTQPTGSNDFVLNNGTCFCTFDLSPSAAGCGRAGFNAFETGGYVAFNATNQVCDNNGGSNTYTQSAGVQLESGSSGSGFFRTVTPNSSPLYSPPVSSHYGDDNCNAYFSILNSLAYSNSFPYQYNYGWDGCQCAQVTVGNTTNGPYTYGTKVGCLPLGPSGFSVSDFNTVIGSTASGNCCRDPYLAYCPDYYSALTPPNYTNNTGLSGTAQFYTSVPSCSQGTYTPSCPFGDEVFSSSPCQCTLPVNVTTLSHIRVQGTLDVVYAANDGSIWNTSADVKTKAFTTDTKIWDPGGCDRPSAVILINASKRKLSSASSIKLLLWSNNNNINYVINNHTIGGWTSLSATTLISGVDNDADTSLSKNGPNTFSAFFLPSLNYVYVFFAKSADNKYYQNRYKIDGTTLTLVDSIAINPYNPSGTFLGTYSAVEVLSAYSPITGFMFLQFSGRPSFSRLKSFDFGNTWVSATSGDITKLGPELRLGTTEAFSEYYDWSNNCISKVTGGGLASSPTFIATFSYDGGKTFH